MCGPHPLVTKTERQQLQDAIERLEALKKVEWCPDALLVIGAAKKHLATLPKSTRYMLTVGFNDTFLVDYRYFDTREEAVEHIKANLHTHERFSITEIKGC